MAANLNKVMIMGRLGQDPELRSTQSGTSVANLSVATNRYWKDQSGQQQEDTEWHRVVVFGRQAENCAEYLSKGRQVYVEGRLQTNEWEDRDGNKRYTTEIVAQRVQFLSGGDRQQGGAPNRGPQRGGGSPGPGPQGGGGQKQGGDDFNQSFDDDDIPF